MLGFSTYLMIGGLCLSAKLYNQNSPWGTGGEGKVLTHDIV